MLSGLNGSGSQLVYSKPPATLELELSSTVAHSGSRPTWVTVQTKSTALDRQVQNSITGEPWDIKGSVTRQTWTTGNPELKPKDTSL